MAHLFQLQKKKQTHYIASTIGYANGYKKIYISNWTTGVQAVDNVDRVAEAKGFYPC